LFEDLPQMHEKLVDKICYSNGDILIDHSHKRATKKKKHNHHFPNMDMISNILQKIVSTETKFCIT